MLTSSASHANFTTPTKSSGQFTFSSANTQGALGPGWWGISVAPQGGIASAQCPVLSVKCAALPASSAPQYYSETAATLTNSFPKTIANVTIVGYSTLINATVKYLGNNVSGATVQVISPRYPGLVLSGNKTNANGVTTFPAPAGNWILYTNISSRPSQINYTAVTIPTSGIDHVGISINNNFVFGSISSTTGARVSTGFNQTLIDTTAGAYQYSTYSQFNAAGYSYSVGAYPAGFSGSGTETFELVIAPIGYAPAFLPLAMPADAGLFRNVTVVPMPPPAVYNTTLNYTTGPGGAGFGKLNVTTSVLLKNYSVFPDLPNASVGQLWGQLALDFAHTLTLPNATFAASIVPWINAQGPFFPVRQDNGLIDGDNFTQLANYTTPTPNPQVTGGYAASYTLASAQGLSMGYNQVFNVTSPLPKGGTGSNYTISFSYRHPTNGQSINYTIVLPKGYVLKAGTAAPPASTLLPGGPSKTWTKFYLVSKPSSNANDTASFSVIKYGNVSARVNVSTSSFTFSTKNVLSDARTNYTVVVGQGENLTFTAHNSTYPANNNGSAFAWNFGDGHSTTSSQESTTHIYNSTGKFVGSLNVTSSGGLTNQIGFTVYVGNLPPTPTINGNWTSKENQSVAGNQYLLVNWSTSLQFNLTGSLSTLYPGAPVHGVISDAVWNLTSHNFSKLLANFSAGAGANTSTPVSYSFQGAGSYLTAGVVNGNPVSFLGWQYNLTLTLWDGQGHSAKTTLVILVRDTQKPIAVVLAYNAAGALIPSSGTVEGPSGTAYVRLSAKNSSEPHNGSITAYSWVVNNTGNSSFKSTNSNISWVQYLAPQSKPYTVNLTVTDRAGITASTLYTLSVAYNTTTRPTLSVTNETEATGITSMTAGTSYTWWVNITNTGGKQSTAHYVQLVLSLTSQTATGPGGPTAGTPGSVKFYNVSAKGVVGTTAVTGPISLAFNQTVRASVTWAPSVTGTKFLWANATCRNCYIFTGPNLDHVSVTISQNQTQLDLEYAAIGIGGVAVIVALVVLYRRRGRAAATPAKGGGRLERGGGSDKDEDEDET